MSLFFAKVNFRGEMRHSTKQTMKVTKFENKTMKKFIALFGLLTTLMLIPSTHADVSYSSDLTLTSSYVFRGVELSELTLHPSVEVAVDDFYAGVWAATPMEKRNSMGYVDEVDFYAGYGVELSELTALDFGATLYEYPSTSFDSTFEAFLGVNTEVNGTAAGLYTFYDFDLKAFTAEGSLGWSIPLEETGTSLDLGLTWGAVEPDVGDGYVYYGASASMPFQVSDHVTITGSVNWASHDITGVEDNHFFVALSIGFSE